MLNVWVGVVKQIRPVMMHLYGTKSDLERVRLLLLERCPELVLGAVRSNPGRGRRGQTHSSHGNFILDLERPR
jgi:hypothetical protein